MKKLLMAAVAVSAIAATPAMAADTSYDVTGTVTAVCSVTPGTPIAFSNLTGADGSINAAAVTAVGTDTGAYCNGSASTLAISHSSMKLQAAGADSAVTPPTGFVKVIDFTPQVKTTTPSSATFDGTNATDVVGAFNGLTVSAKTPTVTTGKPLAGDYKGSITITLAPVA